MFVLPCHPVILSSSPDVAFAQHKRIEQNFVKSDKRVIIRWIFCSLYHCYLSRLLLPYALFGNGNC